MAGSRTLKLSILADVDDLKKKLGTGADEVEGFGSKIADFGKNAGIAFGIAAAAAAAYAGKLAVEGVQAAIEDEAAQKRLAKALEESTGATNAQIAAVEKQILKTSLATGVSDDQLRPALQRLALSTNDAAKAQDLLGLALDIAKAKNISVEQAANALGRAYDGNTGALARLGLGLGSAELKSMTFEEVTKSLTETFGGAASEQADTYEGKIARLKIAFDEAKESVGSVILDALTPMLDLLVQKIIPAVQTFIDSIGGEAGIKSAFMDWVDAIKTVVLPIIAGLQNAWSRISKAVSDNRDELESLINFVRKYVLPFFGGAFKLAIEAVGVAFSAILNTVGAIVRTLDRLIKLGSSIGGAIGNLFGGERAAGGPVVGGTTYLVGEKGPELFTPKSSGNIIPNHALGGGATTVNVYVSAPSIIDQEGFTRSIVQALNLANDRGTGGAGALRLSTQVL